MATKKWVLDKEQKDIIDAMIDFTEENRTAFIARFKERTGKEINESSVDKLRDL